MAGYGCGHLPNHELVDTIIEWWMQISDGWGTRNQPQNGFKPRQFEQGHFSSFFAKFLAFLMTFLSFFASFGILRVA